MNATRGDSRIYAFDCEGQAEWGEGNDAEDMNNEGDFKRFDVQAYRLSELVKLGTVFTMNVYTHIGFDDAEEELKRMEEFRKAQAEIEKKNEKPMSQKMFKAI